jgi:hypothetical protein
VSIIKRIGFGVVVIAATPIISALFEGKSDPDWKQQQALEDLAADVARATDQMWTQAQSKTQAESYAAQQQNAYWAAYQAQAQTGVKKWSSPEKMDKSRATEWV